MSAVVDPQKVHPRMPLGRCVLCGLNLPLEMPGSDEVGQDWACRICGAVYHGVLRDECSEELRRNVRPAGRRSAERTRDLLAPESPQFGNAKTAAPHRIGVRCSLESGLSRQLDAQIDTGVGLFLRPQGTSFAERIKPRVSEPYDPHAARCFLVEHRQWERRLSAIYAQLAAGAPIDLDNVESILRDSLAKAVEDLDLFVNLGTRPGVREYPSQHSYRFGSLAMAMGAVLGLDEKTLMDLGLGCLLHDVGMARVTPPNYRAKRVLSHADFKEIAKHPVLTFELLANRIDHIPVASQMVAYQMHERCNGGGYPRGRTGQQIHELAKIAGVADAYMALVSPRPYRPGLMPYYAVERIVCDVRKGLFAPSVVRALLQTICIFPIGSYVAVGDELIGRVVRTNWEKYDRPLVEVWSRRNPDGDPALVDLAQRPHVRLRPLAEIPQS